MDCNAQAGRSVSWQAEQASYRGVLCGCHRSALGGRLRVSLDRGKLRIARQCANRTSPGQPRPNRDRLRRPGAGPGFATSARPANIERNWWDYFSQPGAVERSWAWSYEPGEDIDVFLTYRRGLWRRTAANLFPTAKSADIVILIDTTGSMSPSLKQLQEKCGRFSEQLTRQALPHRFALIGFGDTKDGQWLDAPRIHERRGQVPH